MLHAQSASVAHAPLIRVYVSALAVLEAHAAAAAAIKRQLEQANERFAAALVTIADVKEAQAADDSAEATVIEDKRNLATQEEALRQIAGQHYPDLTKPGDDVPLVTPQPAEPQKWVATAMDQNLALLSARLAADIARDGVSIAFGGHLPTVDVIGTQTRFTDRTDETLDAANASGRIHFPAVTSDKQIGVQVTIPLFSGGAVGSQVEQAQYQWIAAKERVADLTRQTEYQALDAYSGVVSEISRVKALRKGVDSAQAALEAGEADYEVNIRTAVEVLQERQALAQAQTSYAQARYNYILYIVQLHAAAGTLDVSTLQEINSWLTATQR